MKVKLLRSLGTEDLRKYGLEAGFEGDEVDVKDKDGEKLLGLGLAAKPKPGGDATEKVQAVPPVDLRTSATPHEPAAPVPHRPPGK